MAFSTYEIKMKYVEGWRNVMREVETGHDIYFVTRNSQSYPDAHVRGAGLELCKWSLQICRFM